MTELGTIVKEGIVVQGEFVQRGSDLVATMNKNNTRMMGAMTGKLISNTSYIR